MELKPIYIRNYISFEQQCEILKLVPNKQKSGDERNQILRWGSAVPYTSGIISSEIPEVFNQLNCPIEFDSVGINEYHSGQELDYHFDLPACGPEIAILSLLNEAQFFFKKKETEFSFTLEPLSLCILKDELRWVWLHAVKAKSLRYSVVFRNSKTVYSHPKYCKKCETYHYLGMSTCNF
jgi:hypothetical protein